MFKHANLDVQIDDHAMDHSAAQPSTRGASSPVHTRKCRWRELMQGKVLQWCANGPVNDVRAWDRAIQAKVLNCAMRVKVPTSAMQAEVLSTTFQVEVLNCAIQVKVVNRVMQVKVPKCAIQAIIRSVLQLAACVVNGVKGVHFEKIIAIASQVQMIMHVRPDWADYLGWLGGIANAAFATSLSATLLALCDSVGFNVHSGTCSLTMAAAVWQNTFSPSL